MDIEIKIDPNYKKPKITIHTNEMTPELVDLMKKLSNDTTKLITGYKEEAIFFIEPEEIYCFFTQAQNVFASTKDGIYRVKSRLYEIEEQDLHVAFVRISQSEIINFKYVESLDMELNGTIRLKMKNGEIHFVSRRFVSKIRAYLKL